MTGRSVSALFPELNKGNTVWALWSCAMTQDSSAEEWWAKAQRAEDQALRATDKQTAATWYEIARIYRDIAAKNDAWERAWKPRSRLSVAPDTTKDKHS